MERYLLDTGVIIDLARGKYVLPPGDFAMAAVTVAELLTGVELGATPEDKKRTKEKVDAALAVFPIEPYARDVITEHSKIRAFSQRSGNPRGDNDLMIAATAEATGRTLISRDKKARFEDLPGVTVLIV